MASRDDVQLPNMPLQRTRSRFLLGRSPLNGGSLGPTKLHIGLGICVLVACLVGCASGRGDDQMVITVVQRFTAEGFPEENTPSVINIFSEDHTGRTVNVNNGVFWYSRDDRFAIQFEVDGCPPSGDPAVQAVVIYSQRRSRREAEADVWRWLIAAASPTMPPRSISDEKNHSYFEAGWTRSGKPIHAKAWVAPPSGTPGEWAGVVHLYPREVVIVSQKRGA